MRKVFGEEHLAVKPYIVVIKAEEKKGNLYDDHVFARTKHFNISKKRVAVKLQTFYLGEILIVNWYNREISGLGRKPYKWDIEVEAFSNIEKAIERAIIVTKENG